MFLTYFTNGNANVGTSAGAMTTLRMCNPLQKASLAQLIRELLVFPQPLLVIPLSGSDRSLLGQEEIEFGSAADGTLGRAGVLCQHIRPGGHPMWHRATHEGGAFLIARTLRDWLLVPSGNVRPSVQDWLNASDAVREAMPIPLGVLIVQGQIFLAMAIQRGDARPVVAVTPEGTVVTADEIAVAWHEQTGTWINAYDVGEVSDAAISLGYTLEQKARLPITNGHGNVFKAIHAAMKGFVVGLGVPCHVSIIDTTDGMLVHPVCRALLAFFTQVMLSWGWRRERLEQYAITRPFLL